MSQRFAKGIPWLFWLALVALTFSATECVWAQKTSDERVEFQRIFIPQKDLRELVPDGFLPIKLAELQQFLSDQSQTPYGTRGVQAPMLSRTRLVAQLVGEDLLSDVSCFSIQYQDDVRSAIELRPLSLALRPAPFSVTPDSNGGLFSTISFLPDGTPRLEIDESVDLWCGWSLRARKSKPGRSLDFALDLPPCTDAKMLLRLPPGWQIADEIHVSRKIEQPLEVLPSQWPQLLGEGWKPTDNWWVLELGGAGRARFSLFRNEETEQSRYPLVIQHMENALEISASGTELVSQWDADVAPSSQDSWRLELAPNFRLKSITCDGISMEWEQRDRRIDVLPTSLMAKDEDAEPPTPLPKYHRWELHAVSIDSSLGSVEVAASVPVRIVNAYVLYGEDRIQIREPLEVTKLDAVNRFALQVQEANSPLFASTWHRVWTETPSAFTLHTQVRQATPHYETLIQVVPQTDSVLATVTMRCDLSGQARSSWPFRIAEGWNLESVAISDVDMLPPATAVSSLPLTTSTTSLATMTTEGEYPLELVATPPVVNCLCYVELQLRRFTQAANRELVQIAPAKLLEFRDCHLATAVVVDPGSAFHLRPNLELIQYRVPSGRLSLWQQRRLPRLGQTWLFMPPTSLLPPLEFERQLASFYVENEVQVDSTGQQTDVQYRIRCIPVSGSIQRLVCYSNMPLSQAIHWQVDHPRSVGPRAVLSVPLELVGVPVSNGDDAPLEFDLNRPSTEPFDLVGSLVLPAKANLSIPLLTTSDAFRERGTIWVHGACRAELQGKSVVQLPPKSNASKSNAWSVGYAYESGRNASLTLYDQEQPGSGLALSQPQIVRETIVDLAMADGAWRHFVRWDLNDWNVPLHCQPPAEWTYLGRYVDERRDWGNESIGSDGQLQLRPPSESKPTHRLVLEFLESPEPHRLQPRLAQQWPTTDIPIHQSERRVFLAPPNYLDNDQAHFTLKNRLLGFGSMWLGLLPGRYQPWNSFSLPSLQSKGRSVQALPDADGALGMLLGVEPDIPLKPEGLRMYRVPDRFHANRKGNEGSKKESKWSDSIPVQNGDRDRVGGWGGLLIGIGIGLCIHRWWSSSMIWSLALTTALAWWLPSPYFMTFAFMALGMVSGRIAKSLVDGGSSYWWKRREPLGNSVAGEASKRIQAGSLLLLFAIQVGVGSRLDAAQLPASEQETPPNPMAIILPIDARGQLEGNMAYISPELYRRLLRPTDDQMSQAWEIVSASYQLNLQGQASGLEQPVELTATYELDSLVNDQWLRLPFASDAMKLKRLLVNEVEFPVGAQMRVEANAIVWKPERSGRIRVRVLCEVRVQVMQDGGMGIRSPILPVPTSTLEVLTNNEIQDVHIDANGQVLNPAMGRYVAQLGPVNALDVQWRPMVNRSQTRSDRRPTVDIWLDLRNAIPLAWTQLQLDAELTNDEAIEMEAPADWQPLGNRWGDGLRQSANASSTLARRRYRMLWDGPKPTKAIETIASRSIELFWAPDIRNGNLMSLPSLEIVGLRGARHRLGVISSPHSVWRVEGNGNWPLATEAIAKPDMLEPNTDALVEEWEVPDAPTSAILRRVAGTTPGVKMATHLHVSRSRIGCELHATWLTDNMKANADLPRNMIQVPLPPSAKEVQAWVNQKPCMVVLQAEPMPMAQLYIDSSITKVQSLQVNCTVDVVSKVSQPLPLFAPLPDTLEYKLSISKDADMTMALDAFEGWYEEANFQGESRTVEEEATSRSSLGEWNALPKTLREFDKLPTPTWTPTEPDLTKGSIVCQVIREESGWELQIHGRLPSLANQSWGLLLETSRLFAGKLQADCSIAVEPSPVSNRSFVRIQPRASSSGILEFQLKGGLSQGIGESPEFPELHWMNAEACPQIYGFPKATSDSLMQWECSGGESLEYPSVSEVASFVPLSPEYQYFRKANARIQVNLTPLQPSLASVTCEKAFHRLLSLDEHRYQIHSQFWLTPSQNQSVTLQLGPQQTIGWLQSHGRPLEGTPQGHTIELPLFPNDMPFLLEVTTLGRRDEAPDLDSTSPWKVPLPKLVGVIPRSVRVTTIDSPHRLWNWSNRENTPAPILLRSLAERRSQSLAEYKALLELLEQTSNTIAERHSVLRSLWYQPWLQELNRIHGDFQGIDTPFDVTSETDLAMQELQERTRSMEQRLFANGSWPSSDGMIAENPWDHADNSDLGEQHHYLCDAALEWELKVAPEQPWVNLPLAATVVLMTLASLLQFLLWRGHR